MRQADLSEHIMPAQLSIREQLKKEPGKMFYVRLCNFPDLYRESNILRFLTKKIPEFKHSKLLMEQQQVNGGHGKKKKQFSGSVIIQANDKQTLDALLLLHGFRLQGQILQSWLMGFEYVSMDAEPSVSMSDYEQMFKSVNTVEDKNHTVHNRSKVSQSVQNPEEAK